MKARIFIVIAMVGFVLFTLPQSSALSCAIPSFMESYDRHDLLLHGKLVEKELLHPESENQKMTTLTFDTIKVYKGEFSKTITVTANLSWDDYYREGEEYVLFADKDGDGYLRELCVGDFVSSPSIIKFLDEFLLDPTIGDDVLSLYDVVQGFEADDLDIRMNEYSSLNRGEMPVPEPEDTKIPNGNLVCGKGTTYHEGVCIVDQPNDESFGSNGKWGTVLDNPVSPQCTYDPSQPHKPCDDSFGMLHIQDISTPFEIKLHQTIKVDGIEIEFSGIEDSRCPSDVQCVWEGQAILTFSTLYQTHHESHSLIAAKATTASVGPYEITLNDITPYPTTTKDISEDYIATLRISKDSGEHLSPLKQIKSGVALIDVKCNEGKILVHKYNRMSAACVYPETEGELIFKRGWAVMRLGLPATDNLPRDLCGSYQGKWIAEYKECILLEIPLQCSLLGGVYNECASACRNDPDFPNVICSDNCVEVCSIEFSTLEDIKNHSLIDEFYAKYPDAHEEVRSDHVSYVVGSDDGFKVRMNLHFDESYDLTHMEFYCFVEGKLQHEVAQEDILNYLQNYHCQTYRTGE